MLRIDRHNKLDPFAGQLTFDHLAHLDAVKDQRLTCIDTVAFGRGQGKGQDVRFVEQCFFTGDDHELAARFTGAGHQFKGFTRQ